MIPWPAQAPAFPRSTAHWRGWDGELPVTLRVSRVTRQGLIRRKQVLPTRILITARGNLCELKWGLPFPAARASRVLFGVRPQDVRSAQGGSPSGPGVHNPGGSVTGPWGSEGGVQIPGSRIWRGRLAAHDGGSVHMAAEAEAGESAAWAGRVLGQAPQDMPGPSGRGVPVGCV